MTKYKRLQYPRGGISSGYVHPGTDGVAPRTYPAYVSEQSLSFKRRLSCVFRVIVDLLMGRKL